MAIWDRLLFSFSRRAEKGLRQFELPSSLETAKSDEPVSLAHIMEQFEDCIDVFQRSIPSAGIDIVYIPHLIDPMRFTKEIVDPLSKAQDAQDVRDVLAQSNFWHASDSKKVVKGILSGKAAIFHEGNVYLVIVYGPKSRGVEQSETESVITGPHDSFTESANTNLSLVRRRVKSSHLKVVKLEVGEITKTIVYVLYIKDIVNMELVDEFVRRITNIEIDAVYDGNMFTQYIDDFPNSLFPQFLITERPDTAVSKLVSGRILAIVDGSPTVVSGPTGFFDFFSSADDYYQRWSIGTATRVLRFIAFVITISFTAIYVAVTTYHYEMIPEALILTLRESRSKVPFPPVIEAMLMEVTIELLREAGARLPTKIGQTIGIVGGIVIGQAAVQAGLTSNILIIAVASSAISSFVIPSYVMSASIRLIRFGLIVLAGIWGNFGLMLGIGFIVVHLCGLTSLGTSYLSPFAPTKWSDWKDVFIRGPFSILTSRPNQVRTNNEEKAKMRK
ncbi:spore germination protein [Paenibacillus roseipurpureus]|uniref:Spore germination protein n=1 Tax=Paenibacillus roseopurpureus TaxID=2918901 RepID=A0AA96LPB4_9BACL|nr:spore germination protein [Paenibacillus sp. MBLB1832]WNR44171.1 spore germination protein [Paenibacillus sp. MBLB1832]